MCAMIYFLLLALMWVSRDPGFEGWSRFFSPFVDDSMPAVLVILLCLLTPVAWNKDQNTSNGVITGYSRLCLNESY